MTAVLARSRVTCGGTENPKAGLTVFAIFRTKLIKKALKTAGPQSLFRLPKAIQSFLSRARLSGQIWRLNIWQSQSESAAQCFCPRGSTIAELRPCLWQRKSGRSKEFSLRLPKTTFVPEE